MVQVHQPAHLVTAPVVLAIKHSRARANTDTARCKGDTHDVTTEGMLPVELVSPSLQTVRLELNGGLLLLIDLV